ncbi:uncharacterized protein LOC110908628 [Helianthus annuus]|uniref:uncharacterized protein LOC110908628 n=1 Tax=Helianthus annuus TaxID=4232 RepID=UPI001652E9D7|nr:uncharacterized protein LOC110908628 [Helianthus annuus]
MSWSWRDIIVDARMEYAKFLQEMAKEVQNSRDIYRISKDLDEFMNKLFNDELTLDNISRLVVASIQIFYIRCILYFSLISIYIDFYRRPRLVNMCKYNVISPFGTDAYVRYMLRKRLQEIIKVEKVLTES